MCSRDLHHHCVDDVASQLQMDLPHRGSPWFATRVLNPVKPDTAGPTDSHKTCLGAIFLLERMLELTHSKGASSNEREGTMKEPTQCLLCNREKADSEMRRVQVWEDELWRLTVSLFAEVPGFSYLEPKRHIPYLADLDGAEAETFGAVMAKASSALREVTDAEQVYVYVFGEGIPHLHVHLAPHREGDGLNEMMIKGEIVEKADLESGAGYFVSKDYPPLPEEELARVAEQVRDRLAR